MRMILPVLIVLKYETHLESSLTSFSNDEIPQPVYEDESMAWAIVHDGGSASATLEVYGTVL